MPAARLGVLGGTFDPIHNGHLQAAHAARHFLKLDRVLFVPAGDPWQKSAFATPQQRFEMTQAAINGIEGFEASSIDIEREGPTYTVDTLLDLKLKFPDSELFFVLGSDAFNGIRTWRDYNRLAELATFAVLERPGYPIDFSALPKSSVSVIPEHMPDTSSTECREMIASGLLEEAPIPEVVADYIGANNLYRSRA